MRAVLKLLPAMPAVLGLLQHSGWYLSHSQNALKVRLVGLESLAGQRWSKNFRLSAYFLPIASSVFRILCGSQQCSLGPLQVRNLFPFERVDRMMTTVPFLSNIGVFPRGDRFFALYHFGSVLWPAFSLATLP